MPQTWAPGQYRVVPPGTWGGVWPATRTWGPEHWVAWLRAQDWPDARIDAYLANRLNHGLGVRRKGEKGIRWFYQPTPKGVEFHTAPEPNVLFGGSAGGAKSYSLRWEFYRRCWQVPGSKYLLFRRTFSELQDNHINDARREVALMKEAGIPVEYLSDPKYVVFRRGTSDESWIRFAHCESEGDEELYLGSAYEAVGLDELATFTRKQAVRIASRLRSDLPGVTALLRATSNPAGSQTLWVRAWFIEHTVTPEEHLAYRPEDWRFIPARLYDNPYYMDPDGTWTRYEMRLVGTGPVRARQLLFGDWSATEGTFFDTFSAQTHARVVDIPRPLHGVIEAVDWGYTSPGTVAWYVPVGDEHWHVIAEWKFQKLDAESVARRIVAMRRELGIKTVRYTVVDPSMWNKTGHGHGESIAETFARFAVPTRKGDNDRVMGWMRLAAFFQPAPDGVPWLTYDPACTYTLRSIPALTADGGNPEDVDSSLDDHAADRDRYFVMSRPRTPRPSEPTAPPQAFSPAWFRAQARQVGEAILR